MIAFRHGAAALLLVTLVLAGCGDGAAAGRPGAAGGRAGAGGPGTTAAGAGGAAGVGGLDLGAGGSSTPDCGCEETDYWVQIEGDGAPQLLSRPYMPEIVEFWCVPHQPFLYSFLSVVGWFHTVAACEGGSSSHSCILLDDGNVDHVFPPHYLDRMGQKWALSNVEIDIEHPPFTRPAGGGFRATASRPGQTLLLKGELRVCHVAGTVNPY